MPGVGNHLFRRLIVRFGNPEKVLGAGRDQLVQVDGISERLAGAIEKQPVTDAVRREMDCIAQSPYRILTMNDPDYPGLLLQIPDPPPFLYIYGDMGDLARNIAVVGSRNATGYGIKTAYRLSADMAGLGITVVSGMARGIDTAAHQGALDGGGRTIAVLGSGFEKVYPQENTGLFHRIAESGAVITEFPLKAGPDPYRFPARNRVISGISLGVIVVEATLKSGALITARMALEQNREVFAVPGNIHSFSSAGTHGLIKQGARLVESAVDIIEELPQLIRKQADQDHIRPADMIKPLPVLSEDEETVFHGLGPYPVHIDELVRRLETSPAHLAGILLQLELKGIVAQSPGKMFSVETDYIPGRTEKQDETCPPDTEPPALKRTLHD